MYNVLTTNCTLYTSWPFLTKCTKKYSGPFCMGHLYRKP